MVEFINDNEEMIAIIIREKYSNDGTVFFTPNHLSQQLAYMNRKKGETIIPHIHKEVSRNVQYTLEVLWIKSGKVRADLYRQDKSFLRSVTLEKNDVILLVTGGHGFHMLEESEIIEIKQGPYIGEHEDKEKFNGDITGP